MKKLLIYLFMLSGVISSCKKDNDRVFDQSPTARANETLVKYQSQLTGAVNGWKALVRPAGGGTYSFYFKFNESNRVGMLSDFTFASATKVDTSSYRLKALQQPSLIFDTYSYLHVLADPDPGVNGGTRGQGLRSDFEYYFDPASSTDTIQLVGRFNGSKATLIRATAAEAAAFSSGQLGSSLDFNNVNKYVNYFKRITLNGIQYEINVNILARTITFSYVDANNAIQTFTTPYFYEIGGIRFEIPLVAGSQTINGFTNITWNPTTTVLGVSANGTATTVIGTGQPIKVDVGAPRRWWEYSVQQGDYWYSLKGFHVNGVDDFYGITALPGFTSLWYFSDLFTLPTGAAGDGVLFSGSYGPIMASPPTFTTDGRIIFANSGYQISPPMGTPTGPFVNTRTKFLDINGYYFVQTGATSYDMVSALDGKAWISWIF